MGTPPITGPPQIPPPAPETQDPRQGFLSGFNSVIGPRIQAADQDELNRKTMERNLFWEQMNSPALHVNPDDTPEVAAQKKAQHDFVTQEYQKRLGKQGKGLIQQALPIIQHVMGHHNVAPGPPAPGGGTDASASVPTASAGPPAPAASSGKVQMQGSVGTGGPPAPAAPPPVATPPPAPSPVSAPPPTGADVASTIEQHGISTAAQSKAAETRATEQADIDTRLNALSDPRIANNPMGAAMVLKSPIFGSIARETVSGIVTAKQARAEGVQVDPSIDDDQMVNVKKNPLGMSIATATNATPAGQVSTARGPISRQEADIAKEQRGLSIWGAKDRVQFQHRLALQGTSLQNALKKADYDRAGKIIDDSQVQLNDALNRAQTMDKNLESGLRGDQQAMLSLVANHIGMTLGAQKGARINQAVWNEAVESTPWLQHLGAKFDPDTGYLSGVTLTPTQMHSMVNLAHEKVDTMRDSADTLQKTFQGALGARPNRPAATPPPAPGAGGTAKGPLSVDEARQYLQRSGGDKVKARALAKQEGRTF